MPGAGLGSTSLGAGSTGTAPNRYKTDLQTSRATVATDVPVLAGAFDGVVELMRQHAWVSTTADLWFGELQGRRTAAGTAAGACLATYDTTVRGQDDEVPAGDPRATWRR